MKNIGVTSVRAPQSWMDQVSSVYLLACAVWSSVSLVVHRFMIHASTEGGVEGFELLGLWLKI